MLSIPTAEEKSAPAKEDKLDTVTILETAILVIEGSETASEEAPAEAAPVATNMQGEGEMRDGVDVVTNSLSAGLRLCLFAALVH